MAVIIIMEESVIFLYGNTCLGEGKKPLAEVASATFTWLDTVLLLLKP